MNKQAEETARQGKTLIVFTVVTILFVGPSIMSVSHLLGFSLQSESN